MKIAFTHMGALIISVLCLASCGGSIGTVNDLALGPTASQNKASAEQNRGAGEMLRSEQGAPLSLQLNVDDGSLSYGAFGTGLKGTCVMGARVELEGDVQAGQTAECIGGRFEFSEFKLSAVDGPKSLFVSQKDQAGSRTSSTPVRVGRDTKSIFRIPDDSVQNTPQTGMSGDSITDVYSNGEHIVVSLRKGGLVISRDGGQTWFSKSLVHGLSSGASQRFFAHNDVFYATSSEGFLTSRDFGKTWTKNPDVSEHTNVIHQHQGRVFVDVGFMGAQFTQDNGTNWKKTGVLPWFNFPRTWTSIGKNLFITSPEGLHVFNSETNSWELFKLPMLPENRRVIGIEGTEKLMLAKVSDWPNTPGTSTYSYFSSDDGGTTWNSVFSTKTAYELVNISSNHLVRFSNSLKTFEVRISRDAGRYWSPLALPPAIASKPPVFGQAIFPEASSLLLRSQDRFSLTTDMNFAAWKTFEIPSTLRNSKLLNYKVFNGSRFLVFDRGLLFSDPKVEKWSLLSFDKGSGPVPNGLTASGRRIFTWSAADPFANLLGGLFLSRDGGERFENITPRLKLLKGFYDTNEVKIYDNGSSSAGYSNPVSEVALTSQKIFVSTPEGIALSDDDASTFSFLQGFQGRPTPIGKDIDAEGTKVAIVTQSSGLLLSRNEGASWTNLTTAHGLPFSNPDQVSLFGEIIFIASGTNMAVSSDFGQTWKKITPSQNFSGSDVLGLKFAQGRIIVHLRKFVKSPEGFNVAQYSIGLSADGGLSFVSAELPKEAGRLLKAVRIHKNEVFIVTTRALIAAPLDLSRWRTLGTFPSEATGLDVSEDAFYVSTLGGIYTIGGSAAVTAAESIGTRRRVAQVTLGECQKVCPVDESSAHPAPTPSPKPSYKPVLMISNCIVNPKTGRCDYSVSWTNASPDSCLWIQPQNAAPQKSECGSLSNRTQGTIVAAWLKPESSYTLFLAPEIKINTPGTRTIEKILQTESAKTEIIIQPCSTFSHDFCTAKIEWKMAPSSACLWSVHPLTKEIFLAACATSSNPNGNIIDYPWMAYASVNTFFLARQMAGNPNEPQPERYAQVEASQPWPENTPAHRAQSSMVCPDVACKAAVRGYVDSYANGVVQGWACKSGSNESIQVQIFATTQSTRTPIGIVIANSASEPVLSQVCGTSLQLHRYSFTLPPELRVQHQGKGIDVLGIDPQFADGSRNYLLEKSGFFKID